VNLPTEKHSHGLRRLAAIEAARGSFDDAAAAIERACGVRVGKRQVEDLAARAAADVDAFYLAHAPERAPDGDVLVMTYDAKGVVMRPDGLREATAKAAASQKLATRLSKGEKRNRKRMAEVAAGEDAQHGCHGARTRGYRKRCMTPRPGAYRPLARGIANLPHQRRQTRPIGIGQKLHQRCRATPLPPATLGISDRIEQAHRQPLALSMTSFAWSIRAFASPTTRSTSSLAWT
jgi:hypothetical protein